MKSLILGTLLLTSLALANPRCPIDDYDTHFTGKSQTVDGVLLYQYACARGHEIWARAN